MKREIELKFRVNDFAPIRKKLRALGAKLIWKGREENWFFDTKARILRRKKILLRVREMGREQLTLKEKSRIEHGVKVAHEYEVDVSDAKLTRSIFKHIGFNVYFHYYKWREHWELANTHVEFDLLSDKRKFIEIEASKEKIKKLASILNLDFTRSTPKTYPELLCGKDVI